MAAYFIRVMRCLRIVVDGRFLDLVCGGLADNSIRSGICFQIKNKFRSVIDSIVFGIPPATSMSNNVKRAFAILELLATKENGLYLQDIADGLGLPPSAVHRHLAELIEMEYVRQADRQGGVYLASTKVVSLGFSILSARGIVDMAHPILARLAAISGELVRLAVRDGNRITFVARAQGARSGLIYDGDMGQEPVLFASATGMAWLSCETDDEAVRLIVRQGLGPPNPIAQGTPRTMKDVLKRIAEARRLGYGAVTDSANAGTSAVAVPVRDPQGRVLGTISVAGPSVRLSPERLLSLVEPLQAAAAELASARIGSPAMVGRKGWVLVDDPRLQAEPEPLDAQPAPARSMASPQPAAPKRALARSKLK
jgi:IclR family acetate operon transcriptional repressor